MKKNLLFVGLCLTCLLLELPVSMAADSSLKLHYTFQSLTDAKVKDESGNNHDGTLFNGALIRQIDTMNVLDLGTGNGYLDMGASMGSAVKGFSDFSVATYIYISEAASISGDGYFLWNFSTSNACTQYAGEYLAYRVNAQRYALSTGGWNNEKVAVALGTAATKGQWVHVCYTQSGTTGSLYLNGVTKVVNSTSLKPRDIVGNLQYNYIARSPFSNDAYLKQTMLTDFRVYDRALSKEEVSGLASRVSAYNEGFSKLALRELAQTLIFAKDTLTNDVVLPFLTSGSSIILEWISSNPAFVSEKGVVNRPPFGSAPTTVQLTAVLKGSSDTVHKVFNVVVLPFKSDQEVVALDKEAIQLYAELQSLREDVYLPLKGKEGSSISWTSSKPEFLSSAGKLLKSPAKGQAPVTLQLTATLTKGSARTSRLFSVTLPPRAPNTAYLFAYFTGNTANQECIRFGLSPDGLNYRALNDNLPIIASDTIAEMKAVRDPHIYRAPNGTYYMVVTDMMSSNGWNSNHGMVFLTSSDLVNWTHARIDIPELFPAYASVNRVWAPQTIWDPRVGKMMVYWSMRAGNDPDVIHYAYANADFTSLVTEPKVLFDHPQDKSCIDGDIIFQDGRFNLFFKTEGDGNGIKRVVSESLTGPYTFVENAYFQQTSNAVEGACIFRLIDSDTCILMYDVYTNGRYEFTWTTDLRNFRIVNGVSMNFAPRHGTVIPISTEEAERLAAKWGKTTDMIILSAGSPNVKRLNMIIDNSQRTVFLPVNYGTNLKKFDPQLQTMPGVKVTPAGPQDFTQGAVTYSLSLNGTSVSYSVSAAVHNNPVIGGLFADPEVLYAEKTGKYYIYPTSDGYSGWYGRYFDCFSSSDLVNWKKENTLVDLTSGQVSWASTYAWAPCMVEKKINGEYRYFFYYTANKQVGVAVSSEPTGPFVDLGKPLVNVKPAGVSGGQEIDPDVFTDPVSGKSYLYWGNGYMAGVELNEDMTSINSSTLTIMTPNGTFREGTYVIYRKGTYYFLWSENDTGSRDYRVRYGTAASPLGPITVPANNIVIARNDADGIYGPGHNSVVQVPGKDEWYIVYHRLTRPNAFTYSTPGNYREICIDKLEFNEDGSIKTTTPTLEGIAPLSTGTRLSKTQKDVKKKATCWPNPVGETVTLAFTGVAESQMRSGQFQVEVTAASGNRVMSVSVPANRQITLDCSSLTPGHYLIRTTLGSSSWQTRFVKP